MSKPVAFHDLPPEAFPFAIELFRTDNGEVVWRTEVYGPGAIEVPGLGAELGVELGARTVPIPARDETRGDT